jgi:hypothetical protein
MLLYTESMLLYVVPLNSIPDQSYILPYQCFCLTYKCYSLPRQSYCLSYKFNCMPCQCYCLSINIFVYSINAIIWRINPIICRIRYCLPYQCYLSVVINAIVYCINAIVCRFKCYCLHLCLSNVIELSAVSMLLQHVLSTVIMLLSVVLMLLSTVSISIFFYNYSYRYNDLRINLFLWFRNDEYVCLRLTFGRGVQAIFCCTLVGFMTFYLLFALYFYWLSVCAWHSPSYAKNRKKLSLWIFQKRQKCSNWWFFKPCMNLQWLLMKIPRFVQLSKP